MSARLAQIWYLAHGLPWRLAESCLRWPVTTIVFGLISWRIAGPSLVTGMLAGLGILAIGNDALTRASSLMGVIQFSYRRALIRVTWNATMQRAKLFETVHIEDSLHSPRTMPGGRKVPKLKRWGRNMIRRTPCGMALTVDGSNIGAGPAAFDGDQTAVLRARWRCRDLVVSAHPTRPYLTMLRPVWTDPFAGVIRPADLPTPPLPPQGLCVVGKDSDGHPVTKDARLANLIAGAPGAGKSSECWVILWSLVAQGLNFRTRVYDPKGGQEFFDLAEAAYRYEANATKWCAFLEQTLSAMAVQQAGLKAAGHRKWEPKLADQFPLDIMIIDELVTVIAMMAGAKNTVTINGQKVPALKAFLVFLSQCRAAGFSVIACTQLTQKEAIGLIRDLFAYVTCLRVGSDEMVRTILGDAKLYPAHTIPVGDAFAGIGYMLDPKTGEPVKYRSAFLTDAERARVATNIGELTARQRQADGPAKTGPIVLDVVDDDLDMTDVEQAALDELVRVCQKCQEEFNVETGELVSAA